MKYLFCWFLVIFSVLAQAQDHKTLADNYYALGNYSKAIQHLQLLPESKEQQLKIAKSYEHSGNLKQALAYYETLFTSHTEDVFIAFGYAKLLVKTSKNTQAEKILQSLMTLDSLNPNFPYQLGLLKELSKDSLAKHFFEKAYKLDNTFIPAALKVAADKIRVRNFTQANQILNQILEIDNAHFQAWNLKALNHFYEKNFHEALVGYHKLLDLNRPSENVHIKLGESYMRVFNHQKAIEHFTIAINNYDDQNPKTHYEISQAFSALHYFDKAERHLEIAMQLKEPQLEKEYQALYDIYHRQKKYKKAFETIKEASQKYPNNEHFYLRVATAADNYFKDKKAVLNLYENYMKKFGETGRFRIIASQRITDLKREIHMNAD